MTPTTNDIGEPERRALPADRDQRLAYVRAHLVACVD